MIINQFINKMSIQKKVKDYQKKARKLKNNKNIRNIKECNNNRNKIK